MELLTHKFEKVMLQRISRTYVNKHSEGLVNLLEVCVDEFIAMSNDIQNIYLEKLSWAMMHGIQATFPPPKVKGHNWFEPVAEKMGDGDGIWDFYKEILEWDLYGIQYKIQPPPNKCKDICTVMRKFVKKLIVALHQFQKISGKLHHEFLKIPIGRSLFTPLDMAMRGDPDFINITPILRQCLEDWRCIFQ